MDTVVLKRATFQHELVSNGKLRALKKSELRFDGVQGELRKIHFKNGDRVRKGQAIVEIDPFPYQQEVANARSTLQGAENDLADLMIQRGYVNGLADTTRVAESLLRPLLIRAGYADAKRKLSSAIRNLENTVLKAPFDGTVANIVQKEFEQLGSEPLCVVIDESQFEVEFKILESEIGEVKLGHGVKVLPNFSDGKIYNGRITEINPVVDNFGLITVKAVVTNPGDLLEGMNVKVLIERSIPNKLIIPKSALLLRQNQEVIFVYKDGKALWVYVKTQDENSTSYAVEADADRGAELKEGDAIIISGNLNLAHESDVRVR